MTKSIVLKCCSKCKELKPISEFRKDVSKKDGKKCRCKSCMKANPMSEKEKIHRLAYWNSDKVVNRRAEYRKTIEGKLRKRKDDIKYRQIHTDRYKANSRVNYEIRTGRLSKPSFFRCRCSLDCDKNANEYHHHLGYSSEHWLDVQPVFKKCHKKLRVQEKS